MRAQHHQSKKKSHSHEKRRGWWFVILSFSAAFLYIDYFHSYFFTYYHKTAPVQKNSAETHLSVSPKINSAASKNTSTQFDFYDMLPKIEVQTKNVGTPNAPQLASGQLYYLLQIATTSNNQEAQDLVTKLGVMGLNAYTKPYNKPNGKTQYRVLVGPYVDQEDLDTDRAYLKTNHIDSLLLHAKAP